MQSRLTLIISKFFILRRENYLMRLYTMKCFLYKEPTMIYATANTDHYIPISSLSTIIRIAQ